VAEPGVEPGTLTYEDSEIPFLPFRYCPVLFDRNQGTGLLKLDTYFSIALPDELIIHTDNTGFEPTTLPID
jgi:hypothetical protein